MGLFSNDVITSIDEEFDNERNDIIESFIVADVCKMDSDAIREWCESDEAKALVEANVLRKPTMMRLSKADDEKRRAKIVAYRLAKEANDPLYRKLITYRQLWKQTSNKIMEKYGNKADRIAKKSQQQYIRDYSKNVKAGKVKEPKVTK